MLSQQTPWEDDVDNPDVPAPINYEIPAQEFIVHIQDNLLKAETKDGADLAHKIEQILSEHFTVVDVQYTGESG